VARRRTVGDAALAVLAQQGPLELGELARLVAERGATQAKRPEVSVRRAVDWEPQVVELLDRRWASAPAVLDGAVLTHRLAQDEADAKMLPVDPDLAPLAPLAVGGLRLVSGGAAEACDEGHLHEPPGWLGSRKAGDLAALRPRGAWSRSAPRSCRHAWGIWVAAGWRWRWTASFPGWTAWVRVGWRQRCRSRWWCCRRWWRCRGCWVGPRCRLVSCWLG
jgi:hypothetical protein